MFDYVPLRAEYVLTRRYGVDEHQARNVVQQFLRQPIDVVGADADAILEAYEVSARMDHGVYDCFLVSLARRHDADAILTTDSDFEFLCAEEAFDYLNPVPDDVLARFHEPRDD